MIDSRALARYVTVAIRGGAAAPLVAALVLVGESSAPSVVHAPPPVTSFSYASEPGDAIGGGESETFQPSGSTTVTVHGDHDYIAVSVQSPDATWGADFAAGEGNTLHLGDFRHVEPFVLETGRAPGIEVAPFGSACIDYFGSFTIHQLTFDRDGDLAELDLTFDQRCGSRNAPSLTGTVLFNSHPLSYRMVSHDGDPVGGGERERYLNDSSIITLNGTTAAVTVAVSGHRDQWLMLIAAPDGRELEEGVTYATTGDGDYRHAMLDVSGNGSGCGNSTGTLTVKKIFSDAEGSVLNFTATFSQSCYGTSPPLEGTLHYKA